MKKSTLDRFLRHGVSALMGVISLGLWHSAYADFMQSVVSVDVRGGGVSRNDDTASSIAVLHAPPALASTIGFGTESFGAASARADLGSLGVNVVANATGSGFTRAEANALFRDALRVTGPGLAFGTRVSLLFDLLPPSPGTVDVCPTCVGGASAALNIRDGVIIRDKVVEGQLGVTGLSRYTGPFTFELAAVGDLIEIEGTLNGLLAVGAPFGTGNFSIRLLNTVPFFADSLTPGVTLIAESGHDYRRTVVPLPPNHCAVERRSTCAGRTSTRWTICEEHSNEAVI